MDKEMPKYQVVADWIRNQLNTRSLLDGDKIPSENDLSKMFSVSRHTVRQSIALLEREGLVIRTQGSGTYISSNNIMPKTETKTIGVVTTYLDDYIFPSIIKGIDFYLTKEGYTMQLGITKNRQEIEANVITDLLKRGVDGFIIEPSKSALPNINSHIYKQIEESKLPCIMINGYYPNYPFPKVTPDDKESALRAVELIAQYGHKNIGGIFKSDDIQGHLRYLGFSEGLQKLGLPIYSDKVMWFDTENTDEIFSGVIDPNILKRFAECSAILCYNDQIAILLIEILRRNGINVPSDVSIVSFDDSPLASVVNPPLTTFAHPKEVLGVEAAAQVIDLINGSKGVKDKLFTTELTVRSSLINYV